MRGDSIRLVFEFGPIVDTSPDRVSLAKAARTGGAACARRVRRRRPGNDHCESRSRE